MVIRRSVELIAGTRLATLLAPEVVGPEKFLLL
jgi:hypothetical protein